MSYKNKWWATCDHCPNTTQETPADSEEELDSQLDELGWQFYQQSVGKRRNLLGMEYDATEFKEVCPTCLANSSQLKKLCEAERDWP